MKMSGSGKVSSSGRGGGSPPSPDGSAPFNNPDTLPGAGTICDPAHNQR